jgi:hypothetical protein
MIDDINDDIDALIDELNATGAPGVRTSSGMRALRLQPLLAEVVRRRGSDLLLVAGSAPGVRVDGAVVRLEGAAHVAELRRRGEPARLAERVRDLVARLELGERRARADDAARDPPRDGRRDVDERLRPEDPVVQQRHDLGAAGERDRAAAERRDGLLAGARTLQPQRAPSSSPRPRGARAGSPRV